MSLDADWNKLVDGGWYPWRVKSIPKGLVARWTHGTHYQLEPERPMHIDEYQEKLSECEVEPEF